MIAKTNSAQRSTAEVLSRARPFGLTLLLARALLDRKILLVLESAVVGFGIHTPLAEAWMVLTPVFDAIALGRDKIAEMARFRLVDRGICSLDVLLPLGHRPKSNDEFKYGSGARCVFIFTACQGLRLP